MDNVARKSQLFNFLHFTDVVVAGREDFVTNANVTQVASMDHVTSHGNVTAIADGVVCFVTRI